MFQQKALDMNERIVLHPESAPKVVYAASIGPLVGRPACVEAVRCLRDGQHHWKFGVETAIQTMEHLSTELKLVFHSKKDLALRRSQL